MDQFILDIIKQIGKGNTTNLTPLVNPSPSNLILIQKSYTGNVVSLHIPDKVTILDTSKLLTNNLQKISISSAFIKKNKADFDKFADFVGLTINNYSVINIQIGHFPLVTNPSNFSDSTQLTISYE